MNPGSSMPTRRARPGAASHGSLRRPTTILRSMRPTRGMIPRRMRCRRVRVVWPWGVWRVRRVLRTRVRLGRVERTRVPGGRSAARLVPGIAARFVARLGGAMIVSRVFRVFVDDRDRLTDQAFDRPQETAFFAVAEADRQAARAGAAGS